MSITGERIQERRKQLGINADVLAEYLGVSRSTIFRYENGAIEKIPANLLSDIAKFLHTSEKFLMGWEDDPESSDFPLLMKYYNLLNDTGKQIATERVKELTYVPDYILKRKKEEISEEIYPYFTDENEAEKYLSSQRILAAFKEKDGNISKNDKIKIANIIYKNSQK